MGAFIYSNTVNNKIVELENECEREQRKEFLGTVACIAAVALALFGLVIRAGVF